jgi:hypothetical protein
MNPVSGLVAANELDGISPSSAVIVISTVENDIRDCNIPRLDDGNQHKPEHPLPQVDSSTSIHDVVVEDAPRHGDD